MSSNSDGSPSGGSTNTTNTPNAIDSTDITDVADNTDATSEASVPASISKDKEAIAILLEKRARDLFDAFNRRDWETLNDTTYIASKFMARVDDLNRPLTWPELLHLQRKLAESRPSYHINVLTVTADFNRSVDRATLFLIVEVANFAESVFGENVFVMDYLLDKQTNRWLYCGHHSIRGVPGVSVMNP